VEIAGTLRDRLAVSPLVRRSAALLVAALGAFWLSSGDGTPAKLIAGAAILALVVAPLLAPYRHRHIRKPKKELDSPGGDLERNGGKPEMPKLSYSPPRFSQLESRALSELEWEPDDDEYFQNLRPFYLVHSKHDFAVKAVRLKFSGDRTFQSWQPVATVPRQESDDGYSAGDYRWMLIGYVPPGIHFDAKLRLLDSESRSRVAVVRNLLASDDRAFQSVHLKISKDKRFATSA
jgi:hypothetical protein